MNAPTDPSPFAGHVITHSHVDGTFGTWQCKRPSPGANPDGFTLALWFRVTADRGVLTVTGDFYPTSFARGPEDPVSCVVWMGQRRSGAADPYFMEKAQSGSGHDAVTTYSTDAAEADLRDLLTDSPDYAKDWIAALQSVLASRMNGGRGRVQAMREAVLDALDPFAPCGCDPTEALAEIGQRPAGHVNLAALALQHLTRLLESQST